MWHTLSFSFKFFFFWPHCTACGILVPQPEMEPLLPAVDMQSSNHQTTREFPIIIILQIRKQGPEWLSNLLKVRVGKWQRQTSKPIAVISRSPPSLEALYISTSFWDGVSGSHTGRNVLNTTMIQPLVAQTVKSPPATQESQVWSLGWEERSPEEGKWLPTLVSSPGEFHGRSLAGYSPWGHKESDSD